MVDAGVFHWVLSGIVTGSYIALGAIGLSLVYNISKVPNFAHGELLTLGAYFALWVNLPWTLPLLERVSSGPDDIGYIVLGALFVITAASTLGTVYMLGGRSALAGRYLPGDLAPMVGYAFHGLLAVVLGAVVVASTPSLLSGMVFAALVMGAVTPLLDKYLFDRFRSAGASLATMLIVTLGVAFFLRYSASAYYTGQVRRYAYAGEFTLFGIDIDYSTSKAFDFFLTDAGITLRVVDRAPDPPVAIGVFEFSWLVLAVIVIGTVGAAYGAYRWRGAGIGEYESAQTIGPRLVGGVAGVVALLAIAAILGSSSSTPENAIMSTQVRTTYLRLGVIVLAGAAMLGLHVLLRETKLGTAMRASADNLDLAEVTGIDTSRVMMTTWVIAGVFAAVAGVVIGALFHSVRPLMGFFQLLPMFAAVILGGLRSIYGAILGSYVVGIAMEAGVLSLSLDSRHRVTMAFIVLFIVLLAKPEGIIGGR
ncbi:MAG: branched-chain amino acid ABC transporter permease [Halobacteriota archaeon]